MLICFVKIPGPVHQVGRTVSQAELILFNRKPLTRNCIKKAKHLLR